MVVDIDLNQARDKQLGPYGGLMDYRRPCWYKKIIEKKIGVS